MAAPVIEIGDLTNSSNNSVDTTPDVSYPAYADGDLLITVLAMDDDTVNFPITPPSTGPFSETLEFTAVAGDTGSQAGPGIGLIAWVGTDSRSSGAHAWAIGSTGQRWNAYTILVPAGEFDAGTPIDSVSDIGGNATSSNNVTTPSWDTDTAGGRVLVGCAVDTRAWGAAASGWTTVDSDEATTVTIAITTRNAETTSTETISSVTHTIDGSDIDTSSTVGLVINGPVAGEAYSIDAASGTYTLTGTAVDLSGTLLLDAASGTYTLTGTAVTLDPVYNHTLDAASGSYTLTGTAVTLDPVYNHTLDAASGSYTLTGTAVDLSAGYVLDTASGTYILTGSTVDLDPVYNHTLDVDFGIYTLTGSIVALEPVYNHTLDADSGSYILTGTDVGLGLSNTYSLDADSGAYTLTGSTTVFDIIYNHTLDAVAGTYTFTGSFVLFDTEYTNSLSYWAGVKTFITIIEEEKAVSLVSNNISIYNTSKTKDMPI